MELLKNPVVGEFVVSAKKCERIISITATQFKTETRDNGGHMTSELQAKLEAAEANVKALEAEYKALGAEAQAIEARLKVIYERRHKLWQTGYMSGSGLIHSAKTAVETAKCELADSLAKKFAVTSSINGKQFDAILVKITPKRIYMREVGNSNEVAIPRDGSNPPWNWKYDHAELLKFAGV